MDVSIIVPVFNGENYIEKCIDSLLCQETKVKYEIIVVNDGSTDETKERLSRYEGDARVKTFDITNHGVSYARRFGVENAASAYVCFVDSDDFVTKDYIEVLWKEQEENILTFCGVKVVYKNSEEDRPMLFPGIYQFENAVKLIEENKVSANLTTSIFEKEKFLSIETNSLKYCEDTLFVIEYIAKYKLSIKLIPNMLYNYNMCNETSATNNYYTIKYIDSFIRVPFMLKRIYNKYEIHNIDDHMSLEFTISAIRIFRIINFKSFKNHMNNPQYDCFRKIKISNCKKYPHKFYFACLKYKIYFPILIIEKIFRRKKNNRKKDVYNFDFSKL